MVVLIDQFCYVVAATATPRAVVPVQTRKPSAKVKAAAMPKQSADTSDVTIHWGGHGGSWLTMDPASGITCAYAPNRFLVGDEWLLRQAEQWQVLTDVLRNLGR